MSFEAIVGQQRAKQMLQNGLRGDKVSHAYLFSGPAGTGKRQMALAFAQALFCLERKDDACGTCIECRKVEHGNHPDLHMVEPDGASIKIDQIRELQREFSYRAKAQQPKVYIMVQAEKLTVQAANSLLKFLEEPASDVVAILITDNGNAVLPTIRSRSQWVAFTPLSPDEMIPVLLREGQPETLVRCAVHLAAGLAACREIIQRNEFAELRNVMIQLGKEALAKFASAIITAQQKLVKSELIDQLDTVLSLFVLWFKDMIHMQCNRRGSIVFIDQIEWLTQYAFSRSMADWVACMEQAVETQKRLRYHAQPQLAFEQFIMGLQRQGG